MGNVQMQLYTKFRAPSLKNNRVMYDLRIFGLVWYGQDWFGLVLSGMVYGYCLDVIPCKIWKSYFEKQLSYVQYMEIWFGLVWYGQVWFGFEWCGPWVMQNFELLA